MLIKVITWFSVYSGLNAIADALSAPFTSNGRQYLEETCVRLEPILGLSCDIAPTSKVSTR
jgi:hypothetical protein